VYNISYFIRSFFLWLAGGHKDNRQNSTGCQQFAKGVPRSGHHETTRPSTHHQALPGKSELTRKTF